LLTVTVTPLDSLMCLTESFISVRIAWRQLGVMSPEQAMEQYISLLSEIIPDWIAENPYVSYFICFLFVQLDLT